MVSKNVKKVLGNVTVLCVLFGALSITMVNARKADEAPTQQEAQPGFFSRLVNFFRRDTKDAAVAAPRSLSVADKSNIHDLLDNKITASVERISQHVEDVVKSLEDKVDRLQAKVESKRQEQEKKEKELALRQRIDEKINEEVSRQLSKID